MPYPVVPVPGYSYTAHQQALGDDSFPGTPLDNDLFNVFAALGTTTEFLKKSIRSDGLLNNKVVTPDSLALATRRLLGAMWAPRGEWEDATAYGPGDVVSVSGPSYVCVTGHVSTATFGDDLADGLWMLFAAETSIPAPDPGDVGKILSVIAPGVLALTEAATWALPAGPDADKIAIATGAGTVGFSSTTVASLLAALAANSAAVTALDTAVDGRLDAVEAAYFPKAGGTFLGPVVLSGDATLALHPTPRRQVGVETVVAPVAVSGTPTTIDIVIPSGFTHVELEFDNLLPTAGNPILKLQVSGTGAPPFISGGSDYVSFGRAYSGSSGADYGGAEAGVTITRVQSGVNLSSGRIGITLAPRAMGTYHAMGQSSGNAQMLIGAFYCQTVTTATALRLLWDSGTTFVNGGKVTLNGVRA